MISVQYLGFKWSSVSHIHVPRGIVTTPVDEGFIDGMCVLQREREKESLPQFLGLKGKSGLFLKVPYLSGPSLLP